MPTGTILEGCEPYAMDFGDREVREWLERNLTPEELAEHDRWLDRFPWAHRRYAFTFWRRLSQLPYRVVTWPWHVLRMRALRRFSAIARERGGPMPGPSWKIRTEFGVPGGER